MIFDRLRKDVRIRVSAIISDDGRVLLVAHRKDDEVYWLLPGGGVIFGESLEDALKRELEEELNISVTVQDLAFICDSIDPSGNRHILNISFHCEHTGGDFILGKDRRLHDFRFFPKDEIGSLRFYPPLNDHLISALDRTNTARYLGKVWIS